jgi:hypothetical protein
VTLCARLKSKQEPRREFGTTRKRTFADAEVPFQPLDLLLVDPMVDLCPVFFSVWKKKNIFSFYRRIFYFSYTSVSYDSSLSLSLFIVLVAIKYFNMI